MSTTSEVAAPVSYFTQERQDIAPLLPERVRSVLEFGCAAGGTMRWLRSIRPVEHAVGVEFLPDVAERARGVFDEVLVADLNAGEPDLGDRRFDLVLALDVLEHLMDPARVVRLARRSMTPDATMIISLPNIAHYSVALPLLLRGQWDYADAGLLDRTHLRFFTRRTALALLEGEGLVVRQVLTNRQLPDVLPLRGAASQRWRWYARSLLGRLLPARLTDFQFLIAAGLRA